MLQYQQTLAAQKCYFDPFKPFQRRLFKPEYQPLIEEKIEEKQQTSTTAVNDVYKFSVKRIKKKLNDFILNNYHELFFSKATAEDKGDKKEAGNSPIKVAKVAAEYQQLELSYDDIVQNPKIVQKAQDELKFCEEQGYNTVDIIQECLAELEEKGFVNLVGGRIRSYSFQIREQKQKLHMFISTLL